MEFEVRDARSKNRFFIDNDFFDIWVPILGATALAVYSALCRHSNRDQLSWPSQESIAKEILLSGRQVRRMLNLLEEYNIIRKERVGKRATNKYWLIDKSKWKTPEVTGLPVLSPFPGDRTLETHHTPAPHDKIVIPPPPKNCGQPVDNSKVTGLPVRCDRTPETHPVVTKHIEQINTNPSRKAPSVLNQQSEDKIVMPEREKKGSYRHKLVRGRGEQ